MTSFMAFRPSRRWLGLVGYMTILGLGGAAPAQPAPSILKLSTGSEIATWTLAGEGATRHATPIIFLHGGPGLYTETRRLEEGRVLRAAGFTTVYFDQAGGGKSARLKATEYSLDRSVADLEALRIALNAPQVILWGNSFGASLAAAYASRFPDRVAGTILTSPGMFPGFDGKRDYSRTNRDKVDYSKSLIAAINKIDSEGARAEATLSQSDSATLFDELVGSELIDGIVCKGARVKPPALPGGGNLYVQRLVSKDVKRASLPEKTATAVPTLIVRGSCDFLPADNAERYRRFFGGTIVTIPNSGHGLIENRELVDSALRNFAIVALAKTG